MTATERIPTELWKLAELMGAEPAPGETDLYDRLVAQEGRDRAGELWLAACSESDHETAVLTAENELRQGLKGALAELEAAAGGLRQLRNEAWHPDYAESQDGTDIEAFLGQAGSLLRAAARLVPEPTITGTVGERVLDANGDEVEVPLNVANSESFRSFMAGRVPAACGHYIAASEARVGIDRCERCMLSGEG